MIRLFVGLALPQPVRDHLAILASGLPGARWVPPQNLHVTLRFVGEVDEVAAGRLHEQLCEISAPAFALGLRGCGCFASGQRAHTLWAGVERSAALDHLQGKVEAAVQKAGLPAETRKYTPHVTLARLSRGTPAGRLQAFIAGHNLLSLTVPVERFVLFSSHLGKSDPVYVAEADYLLR